MNSLIKFSLTAVLIFWALRPYLDKSDSDNALDALLAFGLLWSILIFMIFFGMVALYCMSIQKCLSLIKPVNRKMTPRSVWYMFLIPFNFVEDFFIVINLSQSIEQEAMHNSNLSEIKDFGMVTGIGWSIAQVLSFIPNYIGQVAGVIGFILVIFHWAFIIKINRLLTTK
jgi:hypothetical protein